jgi:hypothetical protein
MALRVIGASKPPLHEQAAVLEEDYIVLAI